MDSSVLETTSRRLAAFRPYLKRCGGLATLFGQPFLTQSQIGFFRLTKYSPPPVHFSMVHLHSGHFLVLMGLLPPLRGDEVVNAFGGDAGAVFWVGGFGVSLEKWFRPT